jgi:hypothetical protein
MEIASSAQSLIVMSAILPTPARPVLMATSTKINNASSVTQTVRSVQAMLGLALNARLVRFFILDNVSHAEQTVMHAQS